jgi:hypothetical protein
MRLYNKSQDIGKFMSDSVAILAFVYDCVDDLNKQLPAELRLAKTPQTVLVGEDGALDSLSLITLLASLEEKLGKAGMRVSLIDDPALGEPAGPFHNLESLTAKIAAEVS